MLALGFLGEYDSNPVLGAALSDGDRIVRTLAETSIRSLWRRAGNEVQQNQLERVAQLNSLQRHEEAIVGPAT